ncbi:hypothetical protein HA402_000726 [Bradysia odoriphaga]|nr:hypothetical protein HA402_000726 [Bradysia odoriphaga]
MPENVCIGTNGRMSVPSNREHHYRNLRDRFTNCTYVDGNLELTWLQDPKMDLSFLQHIREVTGYVLISHVDILNIVLPRLQIIRGRTLFKLNIKDDKFGLFITYSQMHTLELPALRDILAGSVGVFNAYNLCHIRTINWDEIITGPKEKFQYTYNFTSPERECSRCHPSCEAGCWGEGEHNCQKFSKINCSPQCAQGRCFGTKPRECCHLFCAGGCTGPTQRDCLACRNFYDDGICKQECPPMQKYNPTNYLWEANPDGKYAYGATCVRNCPEHLLKDNGACVRTCPNNKTAVNGECVTCNGPCPKTCPGVGIVHSGNVDDFRGCTIIEGSLEILDQSFAGFQQVYTNFSFGPRFIKMHPDRLEVFSTLREVTGYINIQGNHEHFTNLSYFRNIEVIGGRQLMDTYFASLYIVKTALKSLELKSLKRINSGAVVILENKNLCFASEINWNKIKKSSDHISMIDNNKNETECRSEDLICSTECTSDGCWGPGPDQCLECKHFKFNGTCLDACASYPNIYQVDSKTCGLCHPECKHSCSGPGADNCTECQHVRDGKYCLPECPETKYNQNGFCAFCHETCVGCTGPRNTIGPNGCTSCEKAIIGEGMIERCLKKSEPCPDGYFYEWVIPQEQGMLRPLAGKAICRKCHPRCKRCTGYGFHEQVCQKCSVYKRGEQCEDECPNDHYVDELNFCLPCHDECLGCTGPGADNCIQCRQLKVYLGDPNDNSTLFNCTSTCPQDYPHKVYLQESAGPFCSPKAAVTAANHAGVANISPVYIFLIVVLSAGFVLFFGVGLYCYQKTKTDKQTVKMTMVLTGCDDSEPLRPSNVGPNLSKLKIVKEQELRQGGLLGSGAFGQVYKGVWVPENENIKIPIAIKTLNSSTDSEASRQFLEEAYIMASVEHPNLLKLLAVCMTTEHKLITQLMPLGSLLDYVRNNKDKTGSKALLNWSTQIARGMTYLEKKRLVHRDLAARNVLVQNPNHIKITDFGLAKLLSSDSDEYKATGGKMPFKWLALESLRHRIFTSKSDVWSFAVTVWELLTFGKRPYENISSKDILASIEGGKKLEQPQICSLDIYIVLLQCWDVNADARPTFEQLEEMFSGFARDPGRYLSVPGDIHMRLPAYTSQDEKDLIRTLTKNGGSDGVGTDDYMTPKPRSTTMLPGPSTVELDANSVPGKRYCSDPMKGSGDDETDNSGREIGVGNIRLDLPLDEDDYLMPTSQNQTPGFGGYMDVIGVPTVQTVCVDNPEYLMGTLTSNALQMTSTAPPTQTIGIPVTPLNGEGEPSSDHEYYNDLQREMQPLHRSETTV